MAKLHILEKVGGVVALSGLPMFLIFNAAAPCSFDSEQGVHWCNVQMQFGPLLLLMPFFVGAPLLFYGQSLRHKRKDWRLD